VLSKRRNVIKIGSWELRKLEEKEYGKLSSFDCSDTDLNEFFRNDALDHKRELLAETYSLSLMQAAGNGKRVPVVLVSFRNDSIQIPDEDRKKFLPEKKSHYKSLPAVKIARLGVHSSFQRLSVGTFLITLTKYLFVNNNRTGCRFVTVDAYNNEHTLSFYQKNGFSFLYEKDRSRNTRIMYYDLKRIQQ